MGKTMFKRKIYNEILEWKEKWSDKYAFCKEGEPMKIGII